MIFQIHVPALWMSWARKADKVDLPVRVLCMPVIITIKPSGRAAAIWYATIGYVHSMPCVCITMSNKKEGPLLLPRQSPPSNQWHTITNNIMILVIAFLWIICTTRILVPTDPPLPEKGFRHPPEWISLCQRRRVRKVSKRGEKDSCVGLCCRFRVFVVHVQIRKVKSGLGLIPLIWDA